MADLSAIATWKNQLIRKAVYGAAFVAPTTASAITSTNLFTSGALIGTLPTGWKSCGYATKEGARFSRSVSSADTESWSSVQPTRSDKTEDKDTFQIDFQETNKQTLSMFTGADLTSVALSATGALSVQKPALPPDRYYRFLIVGQDTDSAGNAIIIARFFPKVKPTAFTDQTWSDASEIQYGFTFDAYIDSTLSYSRDDIYGGPGFLALAADMGFTVAS